LEELQPLLMAMPVLALPDQGAIGDIQSRIQWVDYQLSLADDVGMSDRQSAALWQDRIRLMDTLVKVRSAEAQRFAVLQ